MIRQRIMRMLMTTAIVGFMTSCTPAPTPTAVVSTPQETKNLIHDSPARLTLVHVWATWCAPCREEFPELLKAYETWQDRGLALLLVSADDPTDLATVNRFLEAQQSPVNSLVSTQLDEEFIKLFSPNWNGALPASFFTNPAESW